MKKLLSLTTVFALLLALVGCSNNNNNTDKNETQEKITITHELGETEVTTNPTKIAVFDLGILDILDSLEIEIGALPQGTIPEYLSKYASDDYVNAGSMKEVDYDVLSDYAPDLIIISGRLTDSYEELSKIAPTIYVETPGATYFETMENNIEILKQIFPDSANTIDETYKTIKESAETLKIKAEESKLNALIILSNDGSLSVYGSGSRYGLIHSDFRFMESDETIISSTHGQEASFEYILEVNPDVLFVVDRSAAIGSDGATGAETLLDNDLVAKTNAAMNDKIIYLSSDVWYLAIGGFTSTTQMVNEVSAALD